MDDPTSFPGTTIMAGPASTRPTLATLPTEMLDRIFWLVDKSDLAHLRYVSKYICAVVNRPFAVRNFGSSHHVVAKHSMETLHAVSAHKVFGAYIKTIKISPARSTLVHDRVRRQNPVLENSFVESGEFSNLIQRSLTNIRQHSGSLAIAVLEEKYLGVEHEFESPYLASLHRHRYHGGKALWGPHQSLDFKTAETLDLVVTAMHAVGVNINRLDVQVIGRAYTNADRKIHEAIGKSIQLHNTAMDLCLRWEDTSLLEYKHLQNRLCLQKTSLALEHDHQRWHPNVSMLEEIVQWLTKESLSELYLQEILLANLSMLDKFFMQSLTNVTLEDCQIKFEVFEAGLYSNLFESLSKMSNLRYCKVSNLRYSLLSTGCGIRILTLANKRFLTRWKSLLLIFPDGKSELELTGSDCSARFKDLASYATVAEKNKIRELEAFQDESAVRFRLDYRVLGAETPLVQEGEVFYRVYYGITTPLFSWDDLEDLKFRR
ncbi:hypothetical protein KCU65_g1983, partial [Aureobasidium melanogenum]